MKLLIVGGVAGGASAAARARRLSEDAEIILFERGPDVSFANCGLPYYLGGEIASRDQLLVVTPERLQQRFPLDVRPRSSVEAIALPRGGAAPLRGGGQRRDREAGPGAAPGARGGVGGGQRQAAPAPGAPPDPPAAARHRPARHLHAAEPPGHRPHPGAAGRDRTA